MEHGQGAVPSLPPTLVGRDAETRRLHSFISRIRVDGDALLVSGEAGVGKSALLALAASAATGFTLLRAAGVEFEADVSFSGLNQLLLPLLGRLEELGTPLRDALAAALGFGEQAATERLVVWSSALALLRLAAAERPVLLVIDDLQWLDRSSALVLGFLARRLAGSRIGLLAATRPDDDGYFARAGVAELELARLADPDAAILLRRSYPDLAPPVQARLLAEAEGNPLALLELPAALPRVKGAAGRGLPTILPLGRRLGALYATQVSGLPASCRRLLLLAALEGLGDLRVLRAAASVRDLDDLAPAERRELVAIDERSGRLTFRHPLVRTAIVALATSDERRRAHRDIAGALAAEPERQAWHLGEATVEPDETVAHRLEQAGHRILRRGDPVGAVAALARAADLSPDPRRRGQRIAEAAYIGADVTGDLRDVGRLLADAGGAGGDGTGSLQVAVAGAYALLNEDGEIWTAHRLLVGGIREALRGQAADHEVLAEALHTLMLVCFFGGRAALWPPFHDLAGRLEADLPPALRAASRTFPDPVRIDTAALAALDAAIAALPGEADPSQIVRLGIAAVYVDRLAGCREAMWRVVRDGREGGAVASAINCLILLAYDDMFVGDWDEADALIAEALALCDTHGYAMLAWPGRLSVAILAAARGDDPTAQSIADGMIRWATPRGAGALQLYANHARTLAASARGDFEEAYMRSAAISPPGVMASHVAQALWVILDLVEAAIRTGRAAEAAAHVLALREDGVARLSPRLAMIVDAATAIAERDDAAAIAGFERALAHPGADRWAFDAARVRLAHGERLRRGRAMAAARVALGAALETFERLGAVPWAARAQAELRATGRRRARGYAATGALTPQERQIALLAAAGLSNREIGERVYLSHRTVGAHLYRVFPKLGVTSRAALRDALGDERERAGDA